MADTPYKYIKDIQKNDRNFNLALDYIYLFYTKIMRGRVKRETPEVLMHYCRDWEYPWVFLKSEIRPGDKVLDCGSGFSPLPFIWSQFGAESYAIDKDAMICSSFTYIIYCFNQIIKGAARAPYKMYKKIKSKELSSLCSYLKPTNILVRNFSLFKYIWRPDTWGPVSPKLLREYKVDYRNCDIVDLPFRDGQFDTVSCISVLEHMSSEDRLRAIREMSRVVKNGGKLIITYDKKEDLTDLFIKESGMIPKEVINFTRANNPNNRWQVIGICLVK